MAGLLNPLSIGLGIAKSAFGIGQAIKANRELKNLKMPTYSMPEEIGQITDLYKQQASATEMPGQRQYESRLDQAFGEGVSEAQKTSPSSLVATGAAVDLAGKRMQAIQDLAGVFAEYKAKRQDALAGALQTQADYKDQEFKLNKYDPYFIKRNELTGQRQSGVESMFGGAESALSMISDLQGTDAYLEAIKALYPKFGQSNNLFGLTQFATTGAPRLSAPKLSNPTPSWQSYRGKLKQ